MPKPNMDDLPPRLRCIDGELVKPNGQPIWLHGVNFGNFDEDDEQDCVPIHGMGANALREALRYWGKWGSASHPNPDCRDIDSFATLKREPMHLWLGRIGSAAQNGLWSIPFIDSNCGQSGTNQPEDIAYCDPYGTWGPAGHNFYVDPAMRRIFAWIVWPAVAAKLRTMSRIAMLEPHPEPAHRRDESWAPLVAQTQWDCIQGIRSVDPDTPILVGPREGYDIRLVEECLLALQALGPLDPNLVFTGNLLNQWVVNPTRFDKGLQHLKDLQEKYRVAVFVQQLNRNSSEDPDLSLLKRAVAAMREAKVGYTIWQWKQNTSNPGNMGLLYKTEDGSGWVAKQGEIDVLSADWKQPGPYVSVT
jgi:hypothetical protein